MMCYNLLYSFASAVVILLHRNDVNKKLSLNYEYVERVYAYITHALCR